MNLKINHQCTPPINQKEIRKMKDTDFKLKRMTFSEWVEGRLIWKIEEFSIGDFNILLSNNAQGKTRLFNVLRFLRDINTIGRDFSSPNYKAETCLWFKEGEDEVFYKFRMEGESKGKGLIFDEVVKRNEKILFDRSKKILIDEASDTLIEKFFLQNNAPVIVAITDKEYITFNLIKDFFSRMLFLDANRFSGDNINFDLDAIILDPKGAKVSCVLNNWQKKKPLVFKEVIDAFRKCFPFIENVFIREAPIGPLLFIREKGIDIDILQKDWSDGLLRTLCHIVLTCTQFQSETKNVIRPSFIGIDEVENGLDFNTLTRVVNHYESYSDLIQTVLTSHSPLVCNLIDANKWLVMKRKGEIVKVFSPPEVEDLESKRHKMKKNNWEFYRRHVALSKLYRIV